MQCTVKKVSDFVGDGKIVDGDREIVNFFLRCVLQYVFLHVYLYCSTCVPALYILYWSSQNTVSHRSFTLSIAIPMNIYQVCSRLSCFYYRIRESHICEV